MTLKIYIQSSENPCCRPRSKHFPQRQKNPKNLVDQLSYLKQHWRTHLFSPDHLFFSTKSTVPQTSHQLSMLTHYTHLQQSPHRITVEPP